jgi:nucleotide-binding universal stress UspA family protein
MRWLISTDGTIRSQQAARFVASLLRKGEDEVVLLGVINRTGKAELTCALDELEQILDGVVTQRILREGSIIKVIEEVALSKRFDLVEYASRGRRGLAKLLLGSVASHLAAYLPCSVLIIRQTPEALRKVLIATTLSPGHEAPIRDGAQIAALGNAEVVLMHVMSQITLQEKEDTTPLELSAEQAIKLGTREGKGFEQMLELVKQYGVEAKPLIRYGLVEDKIVEEVRRGDYDLLVLGAHRTARGRSLEDLLIEDVTNAVLLDTRCPVLIVRR